MIKTKADIIAEFTAFCRDLSHNERENAAAVDVEVSSTCNTLIMAELLLTTTLSHNLMLIQVDIIYLFIIF